MNKRDIGIFLWVCWLTGSVFILTGCRPVVSVKASAISGKAVSTQARPEATATALPTPSRTFTVTPFPSPTATLQPAATLPSWEYHQAGEVVAPILLYHHVDDLDPGSRYRVTVQQFQEEMELLKDWGYTALPISLLAEVIRSGGYLPARPVVITFDDGQDSVFDNAFPIMRRLNMPGVIYIVSNWLGAEGFLGPQELQEMTAAGWEIGCHSMTHSNLRASPLGAVAEFSESRIEIEDAVQAPVLSFAYPYALAGPSLLAHARDFGYLSAVGVGATNYQYDTRLFYLSRREVFGDLSLEEFAGLLPWQGAPAP